MKQVEKVVVNQAPVVQKSVDAEPTKPTEYLLKLAEQKVREYYLCALILVEILCCSRFLH